MKNKIDCSVYKKLSEDELERFKKLNVYAIEHEFVGDAQVFRENITNIELEISRRKQK